MNAQMNFFELTKTTWLQEARIIAAQIAKEKGEVCADDIHEVWPIPAWLDRRIMGGAFAELQFIRQQKSRRSKCHHRTICVFRLP